MEFEIVNSYSDPIIAPTNATNPGIAPTDAADLDKASAAGVVPAGGSEFNTTNTSTKWEITEPQIKCDLIT